MGATQQTRSHTRPRTLSNRNRETDLDAPSAALRRFGYAFLVVATALAAIPSEARNPPNLRCFEIAATQNRLDLDLLLAVSKTESDWNPNAMSHTGDIGMMQIQWPQTARHLGVYRSVELLNPCLNIALGARYLRELLDRFEQDEVKALASYNYGPTRISASPTIPDGARRYVERVRANQHRLQNYKATPVKPTGGTTVVTRFSSRHRASAYARSLNKNLVAAHVEVVKRGRAYQVVVADGQHPTPSDRALLSAIGAFTR